MKAALQHQIAQRINSECTQFELIQPLWNGYGSLCRLYVSGHPKFSSIIVKHIQIPSTKQHPRGFNTDISQERKIKSYIVEQAWYQHYNPLLNQQTCPTPYCLDTWQKNHDTFILLEDLRNRGFHPHQGTISWEQIATVLDWLAHFHATFMSQTVDGLWDSGTYWHLQTRPDELRRISGRQEYAYAGCIDARLRTAQFQTIIHGDAKLANFLFSSDGRQVAGVDFQYVGGGCGMKDVAYFISSCLSETEWAKREQDILTYYFQALRKAIPTYINGEALEIEWRELYRFAIADFQRFILGWSPHHSKNNPYTQQITNAVIEQIQTELLTVAKKAAKIAGAYILSKWQGTFSIQSKGLPSEAADIVTEVDEQAQTIILQQLASATTRYDLGLLAEEGESDDSRFKKYAFWTIDPLDGTWFFAHQQTGFAVSIALVLHNGQSILGVVYDPVSSTLLEGCFQTAQNTPDTTPTSKHPITLIVDRGFEKHPWHPLLSTTFTIVYIGGAVMNGMGLLNHGRAFYMKPPKKRQGGCAIWDLAGIARIIENNGGEAVCFDGSPLPLNRPYEYFNDLGFIFTSPGLSYLEVFNHLKSLSLPKLDVNCFLSD